MLLRPALLIAVVLVALAACGGDSSSATTGQIARVVDGDTVVLSDGTRVRLVQIDTPEVRSEECYSAAATRALRRLLPPRTTVRLERDPGLDDVDRYGRELRYVVVAGRNVNLELVELGAAAPYFFRGERGRYAGRLLALARSARAERRGLWGACPATPLAPGRAVDARVT